MIPYAYALAPLIPLISTALMPIVSRLSIRVRNYFSVLASVSTLLATISMIPDVFSTGRIVAHYSWTTFMEIDLIVTVDALSILMATIASSIGFLTVIYSIEYMKEERGLTRYYSLILLFIGSMIGLVLSGNFLQLYFFWELVGVCSYALIGFEYEKPLAAKAGMKALLVTRIGGVCLLLGMLWMYSYTHTFDMISVSGLIGRIPIAVLQTISLLFLLGAMSKSAQLPFHVWLPDAMEAPTTVSALIHAATMVNAGVYLVARVSPLFSSVPVFFVVAMYVGILTAFLAATMALTTNDVKRLLAYSTISQLGYMMFILGIRSSSAYFAGVFYILGHAVFKALLFLSAGAVIHAVGTRNMDEMGGLWRDMPVTFVMCLGGVMALAGFPPFNGFFSKELLLTAVERAGHPYLAVVAAATAVLTVAYSLKLIYKVFLGGKSRLSKALETPLLMRICLRILAAACIFSVLCEEPLLSLFNRSGLILTTVHSFELFPLILSMGALVFGIGAFTLRKRINGFINAKGSVPKIISVINVGYGFDRFYGVLVSSILRFSKSTYRLMEQRIINGFNYSVARSILTLSKSTYRLMEQRIINGFNYSVARLAVASASKIRRIQTGILSWNMIGVIVGFLVIVLTVLIRGAIFT